jgi:hypothetical protein
MSYTPGPWVRGEIHDRHIVKDGNGNLVADAAGPSNLKQETREANARLIASAPELLSALQNLLGYIEATDDDIDHTEMCLNTGDAVLNAEAAIAKATTGQEEER